VLFWYYGGWGYPPNIGVFVVLERNLRVASEATDVARRGECPDGREIFSRGYSIIEILMVLFLIATVTAIAIPQYLDARERSITLSVITDIRQIEDRISIFKLEKEALPDTLAEIGLAHLSDPWGNPYQYLRIQGAEAKSTGFQRKDHFLVPVNSDYDLYSMGPDGKSAPPFTAKASRDDIVRTSDGGYVGPVSGF
jgi:general secretion pathway protein G